MPADPLPRNFLEFWETTNPPGAPQDLVERWRAWTLSGIERGRSVLARIERYRVLTGALVVEIGCGYGNTLIAARRAGARAIGVEPDPQSLRGAWIWMRDDYHLEQIELCRAVGETLPLPDHCADVVICDNVLEHVRIQRQTVAEIGRILRPGGLAYLSFPNFFSIANFRSDPHYGLVGVSVLPPRVGRWYVVHVRKRSHSYGVGMFPVAFAVARWLKHGRMQVLDREPDMRRRLGWLTPLIRELRSNVYPVVTWVAQKQ